MEYQNIVYFGVGIEGTRPLLQHKFGPDALPLKPREKSGVAGNDPEEWRRTTMVNKEGRFYLQNTYLFAAIREGGRYIKLGRRNLMLPIAATLQIVEDPVYITNYYWPGYGPDSEAPPLDLRTVDPLPTDSTKVAYIDVRGVRNPTTRNRNIRYRTALNSGWQVHFTIKFDKSIVSREQIHSALWHAGELVGVGNGRAIGMGRFKIIDFTELKFAEE